MATAPLAMAASEVAPAMTLAAVPDAAVAPELALVASQGMIPFRTEPQAMVTTPVNRFAIR